MAVFKWEEKNELIITCGCGCEDSIHFAVDPEDGYEYAVMTYMNGSFYRDQEDGVLGTIKRKAKKIWAILMNKDYYYSDIRMSRADFEEFRSYINSFEGSKEK